MVGGGCTGAVATANLASPKPWSGCSCFGTYRVWQWHQLQDTVLMARWVRRAGTGPPRPPVKSHLAPCSQPLCVHRGAGHSHRWGSLFLLLFLSVLSPVVSSKHQLINILQHATASTPVPHPWACRGSAWFPYLQPHRDMQRKGLCGGRLSKMMWLWQRTEEQPAHLHPPRVLLSLPLC